MGFQFVPLDCILRHFRENAWAWEHTYPEPVGRALVTWKFEGKAINPEGFA